MTRFTCLVSVIALGIASPALAQSADIDGVSVTFRPFAEGFDQPTFLTAPAGDARTFLVEQSGLIRILDAQGTAFAEPFLDLTAEVSSGNEQGLLGLAFHPDFAENGRFFVNYTDLEGTTHVTGYTLAEGNPDRADPESATDLLVVEQPYANHNGGWIAFGPDGRLYVGMGDGGSGGDPGDRAQNPDERLGKILALDVEAGTVETFALGVRNPWRNAFDEGSLYVADVGQNAWEEITIIPADVEGQNLGWNRYEGTVCFNTAAGCDETGLVMPQYTYGRDEGCSITGGLVYRGSEIPQLQGRYFFADYCSGGVGSLRYADGEVSDVVAPGGHIVLDGNVTSFGSDAHGELYVLLQDGRVLKLAAGE